MSKWPAPGIYPDISPVDYHGLKEINGVLVRSNSMLHEFDQDPAEFKKGIARRVTDPMRKGSIFDCLITQQHRFEKDYIISPFSEFRTNESKDWKAAQTKTICKESEFQSAEAAVHAVKADPRWKAMTKGNCQYQVGLRADINGLPWKGMFDVLPDAEGEYGDAIIDVKRSGVMATLDDVLRHCRKMLYNDQLGLYRGLAKLNGLKRNRAFLYIVPMEPPFNPCVLELGEQMLANGAHRIMRINDRLIECERTGIWPGRFDGIKEVEQADESWGWTIKEEDPEEAAA